MVVHAVNFDRDCLGCRGQKLTSNWFEGLLTRFVRPLGFTGPNVLSYCDGLPPEM